MMAPPISLRFGEYGSDRVSIRRDVELVRSCLRTVQKMREDAGHPASQVEKPSAIARPAGGHLAQQNSLARWKDRNIPTDQAKPRPKKRSKPGQGQAIFSFNPF
jgi:hypothetical protein